MPDFAARISRRRALGAAGGLATLAAAPQLASAAPLRPALVRPGQARVMPIADSQSGTTDLPVDQMLQILPGEWEVNKEGILEIDFGRTDLEPVIGEYNGVTFQFKPSFHIGTEFFFQSLGGGRAIFNGAIACLPSELNPVIDQLLNNRLVFQAEHQHFFDLNPMLFFIHERAVGDPIAIATALRNTLQNATKTPISGPPMQKLHSADWVDVGMLESILNGDASVSPSDGVVMVNIPRRNKIILDDINIDPTLYVPTAVDFEQIQPSSGSATVAVSPDFSMVGDEINPVMRVMRSLDWKVHCLYNQETEERPQLFFSHQLKIGNDPYALAREVRAALDQTNSQGSPTPPPHSQR
ncbi:MAG: DUF1259 domain-containing protein [Acetobacteraceae bacterium]|nr:DUF1259 domain-containing protein [Acetobacteraceae bacterium]